MNETLKHVCIRSLSVFQFHSKWFEWKPHPVYYIREPVTTNCEHLQFTLSALTSKSTCNMLTKRLQLFTQVTSVSAVPRQEITSLRPSMHLIYGVISGSHACRDCVWHIILVAELYTTCPGEPVLVATKFNVTFLPLRLCYVNVSTCFSKDAENLTTYGYVLWCSQIVCTRCYSLYTIIAFYSVIEWSNFAVSVWSTAWQATML